MNNEIIAWWSGGITSAVACKLASDLFGVDNTRFIFIDTRNEDPDTYRFLKDCEKWYGKNIETIASSKYKDIRDIWREYKSLNVATGAICSKTLKVDVRKEWQKHNEWRYQVFGYDLNEAIRAKRMTKNHKEVRAIYPLMMYGIFKKDCIQIIEDAGISVPSAYHEGMLNNNCWLTGCVQGGIGYWQKIQREHPDKFEAMAKMEHELTYAKGSPVTILKDQSKGGGLVFLKHHPDFPEVKDISMMRGREPEPLLRCDGECGVKQ